MEGEFRLFPESAATGAGSVDLLYLALVAVAAFFTILICVLIVTFMVRYRAKARVRRTWQLGHRGQLLLEIGWSVVPLIIVMGSFVWGAAIFFEQRRPPDDALDVYVVGKQWMWKVQHEGGRREINGLHVPAGQPIVLTMVSEDVIHSFYLPAFRSKMDVLPGRYTTQWFTPNKPGTYHLFCAEYCGTSHASMIGAVEVLPPEEYAEWLEAGDDEPAESAGRRLVNQYGCLECHAEEGETRAPPLRGLYGRRVPLQSGGSVVADAEYVRESIVEPDAKIVAGYQPVMPPYPQISESEILLMLAYFRSEEFAVEAPETEQP